MRRQKYRLTSTHFKQRNKIFEQVLATGGSKKGWQDDGSFLLTLD